jgi:prevent-host-death family protein
MDEQMVTLETARKKLGQLVIAAANFDEVTVISKNGVPAAAVVPLRVLPLIQTAGLPFRSKRGPLNSYGPGDGAVSGGSAPSMYSTLTSGGAGAPVLGGSGGSTAPII